MRRLWGIAAGVLVIGLLGSGCGSGTSTPSAQDVTKSFLTALARGDTAGASQQTDQPAQARTALDKARSALKPASVSGSISQVTTSDKTATANYVLTWDLGGGHQWRDASSLKLGQDDNGNWKVNWAPSVLASRLAAGQSLVLTRTDPVPPAVVGSDGTTLLAPSQVVSVSVSGQQAGDLATVA